MDRLNESIGAQAVARSGSLRRYYVLGILTTVSIFSWMDRQLFSILLQSIKQDLRLNDTQLGMLGGIAFGLFYAAVGLPIARLADRVNRRNLLVVALIFWSAMTALCGASVGFGSMFLARMGVGFGEAGSAPASQSMVSDYFAPRVRGLAMGVLYTFVPIGYVLAYATGGYLNDTVGWRKAFLWVGVPGVLLALCVLLTVREPRRGLNESTGHETVRQLSLVATLRSLLRISSLRHIPLAGAAHGLGAFGAAVWVPAYFMRMHAMSSFAIGARLALLMGTAGLAGALVGGYLCDQLVARIQDGRWYAWIPGGFLILSVPFLLLAFQTNNPTIALLFYSVPVFCNHIVLGPIVASMQALVRVNQRATVAAYYLFMVNLISMGVGPLIIGLFSDYFHSRYGDSALRYSIMTLTAVTCSWAALHFFLAGRTIVRDLRQTHVV